MSDEDNGGGERNLVLFDCETWLPAPALSSGDAERLADWVGLTGPDISTGGARDPCEDWGSVSCDMVERASIVARKNPHCKESALLYQSGDKIRKRWAHTGPSPGIKLKRETLG